MLFLELLVLWLYYRMEKNRRQGKQTKEKSHGTSSHTQAVTSITGNTNVGSILRKIWHSIQIWKAIDTNMKILYHQYYNILCYALNN